MKGSLNIAVFHCGFAYSGGGERLVLEEFVRLRVLESNPSPVQLKWPRRLVGGALLEAIPAFADRTPSNIVQSAAEMVEQDDADTPVRIPPQATCADADTEPVIIDFGWQSHE